MMSWVGGELSWGLEIPRALIRVKKEFICCFVVIIFQDRSKKSSPFPQARFPVESSNFYTNADTVLYCIKISINCSKVNYDWENCNLLAKDAMRLFKILCGKNRVLKQVHISNHSYSSLFLKITCIKSFVNVSENLFSITNRIKSIPT